MTDLHPHPHFPQPPLYCSTAKNSFCPHFPSVCLYLLDLQEAATWWCFSHPLSAQIAALYLSQQSSPSQGSDLAQLSTYKGEWQGDNWSNCKKKWQNAARERGRDRGMKMTEEQTYTKLGGGGEGKGPFCLLTLIGFLFHYHTVLTLHTACSLWINYIALINTEALTHIHTETCMRLYVQRCLYFNIKANWLLKKNLWW